MDIGFVYNWYIIVLYLLKRDLFSLASSKQKNGALFGLEEPKHLVQAKDLSFRLIQNDSPSLLKRLDPLLIQHINRPVNSLFHFNLIAPPATKVKSYRYKKRKPSYPTDLGIFCHFSLSYFLVFPNPRVFQKIHAFSASPRESPET